MDLKPYLVTFVGKHLDGSMIVVAESRLSAYAEALDRIDELGFTEKNSSFSTRNITEIKNDRCMSYVISAGDY